MWNSASFQDGITNGAAWYMIRGGMEDWNYRYASCNDVIVELSNIKRPPASQLPTFWSDNRQSMLSYAEAVHIGVRGMVTDRAAGEPLWAQIKAAGNKHAVFTDSDIGDYHRMLLPGVYDLTFNAPGYVSRTLTNIAVTDGPAVRIDVELLLDADLDGSGKINLADLAMFAAQWNRSVCPWCTGDYTGDGYVDTNDLRRFLPYWLANTAKAVR